MAKRMLIDSTHPEETRVAVIHGTRLEEFDFESARKKQIKGNIYLAKVTRVEPSLQACFVEYGGNRHGFLAFNEIHPDYYRIPVADREALNRMVAEAMAAQEDEEEEEERRPRWRRRGRRRSGDSDESTGDGQQASRDNGARDNGDSGPTASGEPAGDQPQDFENERRQESSALDMAPAERATSAEDFPEQEQPAADESTRDARDLPAETAPGGSDNGETASDYSDTPQERGSDEQAQGDAPSSEEGRAPVEDAPTSPPAEPAQGEAAEVRPAEDAVETVGGDEVEDIRRRHRIWQRRYKIQEVIRKRQILLVQVAKEERGNKGAALTTYISLAGRYCVLMPNTPRGGGISRKITSHADRKRLKEIVGELELPDGMAVIVRTAGMERNKQELRRDLDFLLKTWEGIREKALNSTAPALIYEEANLIKRAVRDLYAKDVEEIIVDGAEGFEAARSFMKLLMPAHVKKVVQYTDQQIPLFHRYQVESQIDNMHSPSVQLRSGGYIVLNPTEALVAIDVNSGRSTRERNIEETATRTNLEAADEIARQLRLRDLAGLIVIDFIDMEEGRNRHSVERRLKEALRHDRARIQVGRISPFGLLEMSRQRLRPSLVEASMMQCPHCVGAGYVRSTESMSLTVLRAVEEEGLRQRTLEVAVAVPVAVALYIFNHKRVALGEIERRHDFRVIFQPDETIGLSTYRILRSVPKTAETRPERAPPPAEAEAPAPEAPAEHHIDRLSEEPDASAPSDEPAPAEAGDDAGAEAPAREGAEPEAREGEARDGERRGRRRGRRGGRRRRGRHREGEPGVEGFAEPPRESTLGPFGEEAAAAHAGGENQESQDEPAPIAEHVEGARHTGHSDRSERAHYAERAERPSNGAPPDPGPEPGPDTAPDGRDEPREAPVHVPPPAVAATVSAEPAPPSPTPAPEPPPPPTSSEPPSPPRRGWWNPRRG